MNKLLGDGATAAVLIAQERAVPLYADDLGLSHIAAQEHGVESFWTQALLLHMKEKGRLSDGEYPDAIRQLLLGNYYHVFFTTEDVKWVLQRNSFQLSSEVTRIFGFMRGAGDEDVAVAILGELLKYVWLQSAVSQRKLLFLDLVLATLVAGRARGRMLTKFKRKVCSEFALLPIDLPVILQSISLWERQPAS